MARRAAASYVLLCTCIHMQWPPLKRTVFFSEAELASFSMLLKRSQFSLRSSSIAPAVVLLPSSATNQFQGFIWSAIGTLEDVEEYTIQTYHANRLLVRAVYTVQTINYVVKGTVSRELRRVLQYT